MKKQLLLSATLVLTGLSSPTMAQTAPVPTQQFNISTPTETCSWPNPQYIHLGTLPANLRPTGAHAKGGWAVFYSGTANPDGTGSIQGYVAQMWVGLSGPVASVADFQATGYVLATAGQFDNSTHPAPGNQEVGQGPFPSINNAELGLAVLCFPKGATFAVNAGIITGP